MLTTPITTPHFHSRVLSLLSSHLTLSESSADSSSNTPPAPILPPFNAVDTPLTPGETVGQLVGYCSSWIDLGSPDPLISNISRQVLSMEVAYASFCGVSNIIIPGPRQYNSNSATADGLARYARVVQEALGVANYIHMAIHIPMYHQADSAVVPLLGDLTPFTRDEYKSTETKEDFELFGSWDAWNIIRSVCKYNSRLSVGKESMKLISRHPSSPNRNLIPICSGPGDLQRIAQLWSLALLTYYELQRRMLTIYFSTFNSSPTSHRSVTISLVC